MAHVQEMPKLSDTMEKGHLVKWLVSEGDAVKPGDPVAEVETDKATMEAEAFYAGVVLKRMAGEGTDVIPGHPLLVIGQEGEDISDLLSRLGAAGQAAPRPPAEATPPPPPEKAAPPPPAAEPSPPPAPAEPRRVVASPLARSLAREAGLDLSRIKGSGPGGRVVRADIARATAGGAGAAAPQVSPAAAPEGERIELSGMRRVIALRLSESKFSAPHYYLQAVVDMDPAAAFRSQLGDQLGEGIRPSYNDLVLKAAALALREVPEVNAAWRGDHIVRYAGVHVGLAVALADGLITPVIRDADRLRLTEIAARSRDLSQRARDKKLKPEEYQGSTFSVSNLGMMGIERFTAVIQPGEAAILAVGAIAEQPVVRGGALGVGLRMVVSLSCDHRVVDGAVGARWLQAFRGYLERPLRMVV